MTRREISPALMGSVLLHATVAALFLISWNFTRDLKVGSAVPVNIVTSAPSADIRPAVAAPEPEAAQTEEPVPEAPLESAAPEPQPKPVPPTPTPKATKPAETLPAVKPAPPKKPEKGLDLDALSASVSKMVKPAAAKPSSAAKGPARPEAALAARQTMGTGASAAALTGLTDELQRRWNPNCDVEGGRESTRRLLDQRPDVTAIFAASDEMAMGAILAARDLGRRVPEDLSVIGIDGHDLGELVGLTTIAQSAQDQGTTAAALLLGMITGTPAPELVIFPTELVVRTSTAPPSR